LRWESNPSVTFFLWSDVSWYNPPQLLMSFPPLPLLLASVVIFVPGLSCSMFGFLSSPQPSALLLRIPPNDFSFILTFRFSAPLLRRSFFCLLPLKFSCDFEILAVFHKSWLRSSRLNPRTFPPFWASFLTFRDELVLLVLTAKNGSPLSGSLAVLLSLS